jgi:hypothetical protein
LLRNNTNLGSMKEVGKEKRERREAGSVSDGT